jgi:hypothetical protein
VSSTRIQFGILLLTSLAVEELENSPAVEELILIPPRPQIHKEPLKKPRSIKD